MQRRQAQGLQPTAEQLRGARGLRLGSNAIYSDNGAATTAAAATTAYDGDHVDTQVEEIDEASEENDDKVEDDRKTSTEPLAAEARANKGHGTTMQNEHGDGTRQLTAGSKRQQTEERVDEKTPKKQRRPEDSGDIGGEGAPGEAMGGVAWTTAAMDIGGDNRV